MTGLSNEDCSREERKKEKIKKRMQMTEQGSAEERERKKMRSV